MMSMKSAPTPRTQAIALNFENRIVLCDDVARQCEEERLEEVLDKEWELLGLS